MVKEFQIEFKPQTAESRDFAAMNLALDPYEKRYKTFGAYEQRSRRAANEILERFHQAEQEYHDAVEEDLEGAVQTVPRSAPRRGQRSQSLNRNG